MTPATKRIQAASQLDAHRNADALGAARERCIPDAVARLVPLLVGAAAMREAASLVRPYIVPAGRRAPEGVAPHHLSALGSEREVGAVRPAGRLGGAA